MAETGNPHPYEAEFRKTHTSERPLSPRGIRQVIVAGRWLDRDYQELAKRHNEVPFEKVRGICSTYARATQSAGHLGLPIMWRRDPRLVERNYGDLDQLTHEERLQKYGEAFFDLRLKHAHYWQAGIGESLQDLAGGRIWSHYDMVWRKYSGLDVLEVDHGEVMWVKRMLFEGWDPKYLADMMMRTHTKSAAGLGIPLDRRNQMINTRIIQYTREREDGSWDNGFCRFRLINPALPDDPEWNVPWQPIVRHEYTSAELLELIKPFRRFLEE